MIMEGCFGETGPSPTEHIEICQFAGVINKVCSHDVCKLQDCNADISGHLSFFKLSEKEVDEVPLILSRARSRVTLLEDPCSSGICSTHRAFLGVRWVKTRRTCQHPTLTGKVQAHRSVSLAMHDEICKFCPDHPPPPVGAGMYSVTVTVFSKIEGSILIKIMNAMCTSSNFWYPRVQHAKYFLTQSDLRFCGN